MNEEDKKEIMRELECIERKMKALFPSNVSGHISDDAMHVIMHTDQIQWLMDKLGDK